MRRWYRKNAERVSDRAAAWHKANPQKVVAKTATWNARNADRVKVRMAKWKADNKAAVCAISGRYRAARRGATPLWANRADIDMWYEVAEVLSRGGVEFHVDHVVPLQSKRVCGLHTHDNLTVIPWFQNLAKGNRQWPDMP